MQNGTNNASNDLNRELRELKFNHSLEKIIRGINKGKSLYENILSRVAFFYGAKHGCIALHDRVSDQVNIVSELSPPLHWREEVFLEAIRKNVSFRMADRMVAPLYLEDHGQSLGVIALEREGRPFTPDDKAFLRDIAARIATELYRRKMDKLVGVITRLERKARPIDIYDGTLREIRRFIKYDHSAALLILNKERNRLIVKAERIAFEKGHSPRLRSTISLSPEMAQALAARRGHLYFAKPDDVPWEEVLSEKARALVEVLCYKPNELENSIFCVPLIYGKETLAFLKLSSTHPEVFSLSVEDEMVLKRFTHLLAVTVHNSELHCRREQQLKAIHEIGRLTTTRITQIDELCRGILILVLRALNLKIGSIHLLDTADGFLRTVYSKGWAKNLVRDLRPGERIIGTVAATGYPLLVNDVTKDERYMSFNCDVQSQLAVPITYEEEILGVINVESMVKGRFSTKDKEFLTILASEIAVALEVSALFQKTEEQARQRQAHLELLHDISQELMVHDEVDEILHFIVKALVERFHCETAAVFLYEKGALRRKRLYGLEDDWFPEESYAVGEGITGTVISRQEGEEYGQPFMTNDLGAYLDIDDTLKVYEGKLKSGCLKHLIVVPLNGQERTFGALRVINKLAADGTLSAEGFPESDLELLSTIADQLAFTISDIRKRENLEAIYTVGRKMTLAQDENDICQQIVEIIAERSLDFSLCCLHMLDNDGNLSLGGWKSRLDPCPEAWIEAVEGVIEEVVNLETERWIYIKDVRRESQLGQRIASANGVELHSLLAMPLRTKKGIIGVLTICTSTEYKFYNYGLSFIENFANQAAVAIENARLYEDVHGRLQRKIKELEDIITINKAISTASSLDLSYVLRTIADSTVKIMDADVIIIYLYEAHRGEFRPAVDLGIWDRQQLSDPTELLSFVDRVAELGVPYVAGEAREDDSTAAFERFVKSEKLKSCLGLPLRVKDKIVGVILIGYRKPRHFSDEEISGVISILANQAAIAIQNALLHKETEHRLAEVSTLYTLANQMTSSLDLNTVLDSIVIILKRVIDCRSCCIFLLDEESRILEIKAACGVKPRWVKEAKLRVGEGISGIAVRDAKMLYVPDTYNDPNFVVFDPAVRSLLVVPLIIGDKVIGTLSIDDDEIDAFDHNEARLLTIAAAQTAVAIENVRRFEALQKANEELQRAQRALEEAHRKRLAAEKLGMLNAVSEKFAHHLSNVVGMIPAIVKEIHERVQTDDPQVLMNLKWLEEDIRQLIDIADQLRKPADEDDGKPSDVRATLSTAIEKVLRSDEVKAKVELVENYEEDLPFVKIINSHLLEIFVNIIANAVDAMKPEGGRLEISSRLSDEGRWVEIEISDTGVGMPESIRSKVFDLFFSTKAGQGLGLAMWWSKTYLQELGGDISVRSEEDKGSTFTVKLPVDGKVERLPPFIQRRIAS